MHRFVVSQELIPGNLVIADRGVLHQVKDVLHLHREEKILVCDGRGNEAEGEIMGLGKKVFN